MYNMLATYYTYQSPTLVQYNLLKGKCFSLFCIKKQKKIEKSEKKKNKKRKKQKKRKKKPNALSPVLNKKVQGT